MPVLLTSGYIYFIHSNKKAKCDEMGSQVQKFETRRENIKLENIM